VTLVGPAILVERESTLVVPPGARVTVDAAGNALLTLGGRAR
jgi:N-methylhydantoinase A/oxoprolinase/acetone carboxylase beta subunit